MGTVPDYVTLTLGFSAADTTVVGSRELRIYDKNERDADPTASALINVSLANTVNRYEYDVEADKMLEVEFWDVATAGGVSSEHAITTIAVNREAVYAKPPTPTVEVLMVEDVSGESSVSS